MATAQQVIELVFNGIDKTGAATQSALSNVNSFAGNVQTATQPIANLTGAALKLEAGILAAGVAMVAFSIKSAGDFDTAFRQISTLFDATTGDVAAFKTAILDYSKTSSKSLEDITNSIQAAVGSGVKYSDSLALIAVAEKLAVATRADLKSTTEVLVSTMNVYGLKTSEAGTVSDLFFQTIKDGKIEMDDLATSLSKVSPVAQVAGVSLKEMLSAIAVLTAQGVAPATAIEYLRSALSNIIKPSKDAQDTAAELGIQFDAASLKSKGLAVVLGEMGAATKGNAEQMNKLVGDAGGFVAVSILAKDGAKALKDELVSMGGATGSTAAAFGKMTDSISVSTQKIANAFGALAVEIGTPLLNEFGGIAAAIAAIFNALGASVKEGSLNTLVKYVEGLMGDLQRTLETVARNLPAALEKADFSGFKNGIDVVVQAIKNLFGNIDLSTVEGLRKAIEVVGAAFQGLSLYVAGVIESFKPLFDKLVEVGSGLATVDGNIFKTAGQMAGFVTQANLLASGLNTLLPALDALVGILLVRQGIGLAGALGVTTTAVAGLATNLGAAGLVAAAGAAGYGVGTLLVEPLNKLATAVTGSQDTLGGLIHEFFKGHEVAQALGEGTGAAAKGVDKLTASMADSSLVAKAIQEDFRRSETSYRNLTEVTTATAEASKKLTDVMNTTANGVKGVATIIDAATGKVIGYEQAMGKGAIGVQKVADATKKAEEATKSWAEQVAKMNFEEKLKLIESQTKITTASIEADAKKTVAAFESIGATITSTGTVLSALVGQFKDFGTLDYKAIREIEKQVNKENDLRERAFQLQKALTEAQIAMMKAQTDALVKGDGLIKIDGAGLQPHLEAFMWEILRTLQIKVNKDGLKMLLGV